MVKARQGGAELDFAEPNNSLDQSAGSAFLNLID